MEGAWRKVRRGLGLRLSLCVHAPAVARGSERRPAPSGAGGCRRDVAVTVPAAAGESGSSTSSSLFRRSKSGGRPASSSKDGIDQEEAHYTDST